MISKAIYTALSMILVSNTGCSSMPATPPIDSINAAVAQHARNNKVSALLWDDVKDWEGTPYAFGGSSKRGIDCSAYVQRAYRDLFSVELPRSTKLQRKAGNRIPLRDLQPGDLIFFKPSFSARHVGIYLGNDQFAHASTSKGITRSNVNSRYWRSKLSEVRRVLDQGTHSTVSTFE